MFISHAARDAKTAERLKKLIQNVFLDNHDVFLSSDLTGGDDWLAEITEFLKKKPLTLVLVTKSSLNRPWVWFEVGASWHAGATVIPVKAADIRRLPDPLARRQARRVSLRGLTDLCVDIGKRCGVAVDRRHARQSVKGVFPGLK